MIKTTCPQCESSIKLRPGLRLGQEVRCQHCHTPLAVIDLDPIELDVAHSPDPKRSHKAKVASRRLRENEKDRISDEGGW